MCGNNHLCILTRSLKVRTVQPSPCWDPPCTRCARNTVAVGHWPCTDNSCFPPRWRAAASQPDDCESSHLVIYSLCRTDSTRTRSCRGSPVSSRTPDSLPQPCPWSAASHRLRRFASENVCPQRSQRVSWRVLRRGIERSVRGSLHGWKEKRIKCLVLRWSYFRSLMSIAALCPVSFSCRWFVFNF